MPAGRQGTACQRGLPNIDADPGVPRHRPRNRACSPHPSTS
jgi:hypothetical protein